jgi:hypothetical protein
MQNIGTPMRVHIIVGIAGNVDASAMIAPMGSARIINANMNPSTRICRLNNARSRIERDVPTPVNADHCEFR